MKEGKKERKGLGEKEEEEESAEDLTLTVVSVPYKIRWALATKWGRSTGHAWGTGVQRGTEIDYDTRKKIIFPRTASNQPEGKQTWD